MIINNVKYVLPLNNYISVETIKKQVVLGHTFNHDMRHVLGWLHRYNGEYKKTAAFTIDINGVVYQHFEPKYHSRYFNNSELDKKSIVVLIENEGWLLKDNMKNEFITWVGDIYNKSNEVVDKKWRGHDYWSSYNEKQIESAIELIKKLCCDFSIPMTSISHNTKIDNLVDYTGVMYKSNLEKHYSDLSPSWDFIKFKNKLETI